MLKIPGFNKKKYNLHSIRLGLWLRFYTLLYKFFLERLVLYKNSFKKNRNLEIGPGEYRIPDFETFNKYKTPVVDYLGDLSRKLPFENNSFDLLYLSHVLEHMPWYKLDEIFSELNRIVKVGGCIEIWVPDGLKIAKAFIEAEEEKGNSFNLDGWYRFNPTKDPAIWANGRIFSYGDGEGTLGHPNWHLAIFSKRYLIKLLSSNGFSNISVMENKECRGYDHGWINLGIRAYKL